MFAIGTAYHEVAEKLGNHGLCCVGFGVVVKLLKHPDFFEASTGEGDLLDGNVLSGMLVPCQPDGRPTAKAEYGRSSIGCLGHRQW